MSDLPDSFNGATGAADQSRVDVVKALWVADDDPSSMIGGSEGAYGHYAINAFWSVSLRKREACADVAHKRDACTATAPSTRWCAVRVGGRVGCTEISAGSSLWFGGRCRGGKHMPCLSLFSSSDLCSVIRVFVFIQRCYVDMRLVIASCHFHRASYVLSAC